MATGTRITLLVRHLPEGLPADTLKRLFSHYGASDFRLCQSGRVKNCAFLDYDSEAAAAQAQSQMHRLKFLGKVLSVERATSAPSKDDAPEENATTNEGAGTAPLPPPLPPSTSEAHQSHRREPISPSLGVDYPFPPQLEYAYPPPDGNILTNIVNTLIAVPRFYTQMLVVNILRSGVASHEQNESPSSVSSCTSYATIATSCAGSSG